VVRAKSDAYNVELARANSGQPEKSVVIRRNARAPGFLFPGPGTPILTNSCLKEYGGSARESNPPTPRFTRHNGFEAVKLTRYGEIRPTYGG